MSSGAKRAFIFLTLLTLLLAAAGLITGVREISGLREAVTASCKFDADLGSAPISLNPATNKPSLLGVTIVSDARVAWHGLHCPGALTAADPSFIRWARYYRLPYK